MDKIMEDQTKACNSTSGSNVCNANVNAVSINSTHRNMVRYTGVKILLTKWHIDFTI